MQIAQAALGVLQRAAQQKHNLLCGQRLQNVHARARQQRRDHLERRILRRRTNEPDASLLDIGEERVLLSFVEAVYFIDEHDGARAILPRALGIGHHLLDFLDAGQHRRKLAQTRRASCAR